MSNTTQIKRAHFIGIGGAGMSGIALVLHQGGCEVTGSDLKKSHYVRQLAAAGIEVRLGHEAANIDDFKPDVVVTSTAIPATNPEVIRARELGIPIWPRAKMLSALGAGQTEVAVAGTHGKTTTSSMVAWMLDHLGWDPSFLIGGVVEGYDTNGRAGNGGYFVCEADESDGSFLLLTPNVVVVTNIEADHLDHYGNLANIEKAFGEFMSLVGEDGYVVVMGDAPRCVEIAHESQANHVVTYGFGQDNDFVCEPKGTKGLESHFDVRCPDGTSVSVVIKANPGRHNMANATAAIAVASVLGADLAQAAEALSSFKGARRRFTHVGDIDGITVVDDYGHHPTEIAATLGAAKDLSFDRVVCVFQPHRYSRTQALGAQFAHAFGNADVLLVTDIFPAGETPIPGVTGKALAAQIAGAGEVPEVSYVASRKDVVARLCEVCRPGDLLITQGAGDVTAIGPAFIVAKQAQAEGAGA